MALFGAPEGISGAADYTAQLGQIAMMPARQRLLTAQAGSAEMQLQEEKAFAQGLQEMTRGGAGLAALGGVGGISGVPGTSGFSGSDMVGQMANMAFMRGAPQRGMQLLKDYSAIKGHEATMFSAKVRADATQLKMLSDQEDWFARHAMDANDELSWQKVNQNFEQTFGRPSPYRAVPWNPQLPGQVAAQSMKVKDRVELLRKEQQDAATRAWRAERLKFEERRTRATESQAATARQREARLEQDGGRQVSAPSHEDILEATRILRMDVPGLDVASDEAQDFAHRVASRAHELQGRNRALGRNEAIAQAYEQLKPENVFVPPKQERTLDPRTWFGGGEKPAVGRGAQRAAQKALAEKYGQPYDPAFEYRESPRGLERRKR